MARENGFDVLVTRELDRFARNLAKQLVIESEFKRHGVEVEYILAEYDESPEGKLNKHIRAVIAEFEREKINQRMTRGRRQIVRRGKVMLHGGSKAPYGYRLEDGMLVIYEPEAKIVRLIFTWYVEDGLSIKAIANRLTKDKIPTWADVHGRFKKKRGRGEWGAGAVAGILKNETYTGVWHYGKKRGVGNFNPEEYTIAIEVPAIISCELWEKAQKRRAYNKKMARRNLKGAKYLVGRRVTCQCGSRMRSRIEKGKYRYYFCPASVGKIVGKECGVKYFQADQVDRAVWEKVKEWLQDPEVLQESLEKVKAKLSQKNRPLLDRLSVVDDLLADNRQKLERLLDLYLAGDFPKEVLTDRKARLETTIASLEEEQADLVMALESQNLTDEQIKTIVDFAKRVSKGLGIADRDFEARRRIIDMLDVQVRLAIEDDLQVAYVRWLVKGEQEERLSIDDERP